MKSAPQITIIIPIHNRILFLPQVLEYYSLTKSAVSLRIIIADSSAEENVGKNKEVISKFGDLNILYLVIRGADQTLFDKIIGALEHVKTEFCVCCADDDFITISGLKATCEFLQSNPDFVVAHGAYISFHTRPNSGKPKLYWRPAYFNHSVDADSADNRLTDQFLNCKHTLYAVHRTSELKYIYEEVKGALDSKVQILLFGEFLSSMLAAIRGKIKDLSVFYSARREDAYYQGQHVKWPQMRDYIREGKFDVESIKFKESLVKNLLARSDLRLEEARVLVNEGLRGSIKKGLPPDRFRHLVLNASNFLKDKNAPDWLYKSLSRVYRTFVPVKRGGNTDDLAGTNLSAYNEDFKIFRDVVLKNTLL